GEYAFYRPLAVSGNDLYAGRYFTNADGIVVNSIAKWNGSSWVTLGSGIDGSVNALTVSGTNVYVGGYLETLTGNVAAQFQTARGSVATGIAKWNGTGWSALAPPRSVPSDTEYATVTPLAASGSDLYAGGYFTTAGGTVANHIAKWNGSGWSALGSGV